MDDLPSHLVRYPTQAGREALAARLGLSFDPSSQDWEWQVADPTRFGEWLSVYREAPLSDDERFSLMEMLIQCVEDMLPWHAPPNRIAEMPEWQAVSELLRASPVLHASTIAYWSVFDDRFDGEEPNERFRVSLAMRQIWGDVLPRLRR